MRRALGPEEEGQVPCPRHGFQPGSGDNFSGLVYRSRLHPRAQEVMDPGPHRDNRSCSFIAPEGPLFGNDLLDSRGHV